MVYKINLSRKEIRTRLTPYARRSLAQKQRWLTKKWLKGEISIKEFGDKEQKLYDNLALRIEEADKHCKIA